MRLKTIKISVRKLGNGTGYDQVPSFGLQLLANEAFHSKMTITTSWSIPLKIILALKNRKSVKKCGRGGRRLIFMYKLKAKLLTLQRSFTIFGTQGNSRVNACQRTIHFRTLLMDDFVADRQYIHNFLSVELSAA